jgi:hypothetical protein
MRAGFWRASLRWAGLVIPIVSKQRDGRLSEAPLRWEGFIISIFSKQNEGGFWEGLASLGWIDNFGSF